MGVFYICILLIIILLIISFTITKTLTDDLRVNDNIYLFFDGILPKMNRKATINRIEEDLIYIYDILPLPLDYTGRFYATGVTPDGVKLIYVRAFVFIYFAKIAELLRRKKRWQYKKEISNTEN